MRHTAWLGGLCAALIGGMAMLSVAAAQDPDRPLDAPVEREAPPPDPSGIDDLDRGEPGEAPPGLSDSAVDRALRRRDRERAGEDYDPTPSPEDREEDAADTAPAPLPYRDIAPREAKPAASEVPPSRADLIIASWGGAYAQAQRLAIADPFEQQHREKLAFITHDGTPDGIRAMLRGRDRPDVIDLDAETARDACAEGLLETLDEGFAGDAADFLPNTISRCAIGSTSWSALLLYDKRAFPKAVPSRVEDVFDLKRFPGKRAILRDARYALEMAVLADGNTPDEVYATLDTPVGYAGALARLEAIRNEIVWVDKPADGLAALREGRAAFAIGFIGRAFEAVVAQRAPIGLLWSGQVTHLDMWAIPRGAPHPDRAREFLRFALAPERLAAQTRWLPYGPVRVSALAQVGRHAEVDIDMRPFVPTMPQNAALAVTFNAGWWRANGADVAARIAAWPPYVAPKAKPAREEPRKRTRRRERYDR